MNFADRAPRNQEIFRGVNERMGDQMECRDRSSASFRAERAESAGELCLGAGGKSASRITRLSGRRSLRR
jgi:hypothetical protein